MKNLSTNLRIKCTSGIRLISLTIMLAMIIPAIANAQTGKVNFSGTWTLNAEKSTLNQGQRQGQGQGGNQRMAGGNFVAKQEANLLSVERTRTNQNGESSTTTMKYTLDGKESVNASQRGDSKSVAKWSADGKSLTIETSRTVERNGQSSVMKSTEVWTLTDSKTLSVVSTSTTPNGERKITLIYDKK